MKIALISDLHAEFKSQHVPQLDQDVDVLVLAGDIDNCKKAIQRGLEIADGHARHIVQVAGNHEFYGERLDKGYKRLRDDADAWGVAGSDSTEVHFLQNDMVIIDNVKFLGGTLWTDYQLYGRASEDMYRAESYMNDHRRIKFKQGEATYRRFLPKDALEEHILTRQFIAREKSLPFKGKRVVVTHHAPSALSIHSKYADSSELNSAYATNLEHYFHDVDYWFHGHMHDPSDYTLYGCNVIANPHGYPGERDDPQIRYIEC